MNKLEKAQDRQGHYVTGWLETGVGKIPRVSAALSKRDRWEHFPVRLAIGRMSYRVQPGLYALGNPGPDSLVLVSANFKLSFDSLRKELGGLDAWILVLDTKGINVWCAANKGTFGTEELVKRIEATGLKKIVNTRRLIVPQLGAAGVAAHLVKKLSGFGVIYGPVRAADMPAFLSAGMKAGAEMRRVRFNFSDRLLLVPVEVVQGFRYLLFLTVVFLILSGLHKSGYSFALIGSVGVRAGINLLFAFFAGVVLGPLLLPWLPGRAFFIKGFFCGTALFAVSYLANLTGLHAVETAAWLLLMPALASFATMNFTGASTYTSLSGVKREMRLGVPLQLAAAVPGALLWFAARFL